MSFCDFHYFSNILGKHTAAYVLLPDAGTPPFPVCYLLHGLSDDHTVWLRRTRIELFAARYPLIVVMPDGFRGFYTNNDAGPAYATYMAEELPGIIERTFPALAKREGRCVGGLSMGGYGALRLALGYPDRYISANSHSGALRFNSSLRDAVPDEYRRIFGEDPRGTDHDVVTLAERAMKAGQPLPALRIDCGTEDFLRQDNRQLHRAFEKLNIPHEYEEFPGAHDWIYWDQHVQEALAFHAAAMKIKPV